MGSESKGRPGTAKQGSIPTGGFKPSLVGALAIYAAFAAIALQTYIRIADQALIPSYLALLGAYLILYSLTLWMPVRRVGLLSVYLLIQSGVIIALLWLDPEIDVVTGLFTLLCYQVGQFFSGRTRWVWLGILFICTVASLIYFYDPLNGLALGMTPAAAGIALAFLVIANQEAVRARREGEAIVAELERSHEQLIQHAEQVEQLAAIEERNRLARELHDTVSQTIFSISLTTRSTQLLLERDPDRVRENLEILHELTTEVLVKLRDMVTRLRPPVE